jgi:hypothetical protein
LQIKPIEDIYDYVLVVPICHESVDCLRSITVNISDNILIIAVINSPTNNNDWQQSNELTIKELKDKSYSKHQLYSHCQLLKFKDLSDVIIVDKNTQNNQINQEYGVGLARKIGCDIALKLYTNGCIKNPWIFSTDADVTLPKRYFSLSIENSEKYSAIVLDFEHTCQSEELRQLQYLYDFKLRYYHAGITFAGSSYDYIPLGSTLIVNMLCYAQVRGFPKRNAGEDFYLLNKLAKLKPINYLINENLIVKIESRFSDRVPFGTGPALTHIKSLKSTEFYDYYHPQCFILLQEWFVFLDGLYGTSGLNIHRPTDKNLSKLYDFFSCKKIFYKALPQITSQERWIQFTHQWFDAFKVLKSVHFFDKKYSRLNYLELLKTDSFDKVMSPLLKIFLDKI